MQSKKTFLYFLAASALIALMASCAKEQIKPEEVPSDAEITPEAGLPSDEMVTIHFTATSPSPVAASTSPSPVAASTSKTTVTEEGVVTWKEGDEITLYYIEGGVAKSTSAIAGADGKSSSFTATIPAGTSYLWATYPAGCGNLTNEGLFTIDFTAGTPTGSFASANFAVAYTAIADIENVSLTFTNAGAILRVPIPSGGILSHDGNPYTIASITVADKNGTRPFLGTVGVSVNGGNLDFADPTDVETSTSIILDAAARAQECVYIPSLPFSSTDGLVFHFTDIAGKPIPAAVTKDGSAINLDRGHIKQAAAVSGIVWDWYFDDEAAPGGNGKSAENPMGISDFQNMLNATSSTCGQWRLNGATLHLADGTYTLTEQLNIQGTETGDIIIVGASKEGTLLDGETLGATNTPMILMNSAMSLSLTNVTLQKGKTNDKGAAILYPNTSSGNLILTNCNLDQNTSTVNAGAVYLQGTGETIMDNCTFNENTASRSGGAICISSTSVVRIKDCLFSSNTARGTGDSQGGGAIYIGNAANIYINQSEFNGNTSSSRGGAILCTYAANTKIDQSYFIENVCETLGGAICANNQSSKIFINRTAFYHNQRNSSLDVSLDAGNAVYAASKPMVGFYNCTFNYNRKSEDNKGNTVAASQYIIANSSIRGTNNGKAGTGGVYSAILYSRATAEHMATLANSYIINTSGAQHALSNNNSSTYNYLDNGYNLLSVIISQFTAAKNIASNYIPASTDERTALSDTFKDMSPAWKFQYFVWDGDISGFSGYGMPKLSDIETLIKANTIFGAEFWAWLKSITVTYNETAYDATQVDVRGIPRNASAVWPGSYQQDAQD